MSDRWLRIAALVACVFFGVTGWTVSESFMGWAEETMVFATPAARSLARDLDANGDAVFERSCASDDAPTLLVLDGRPRLVVCAAGRQWPLMIAGYLSGVFAWPLGLLWPLHHDNLLVLRKIGLLFGLFGIYLSARVIGALAGKRAGLWVAVATAVTPIFITAHSVWVAYEMAPWLFLLLAICVALGIPVRPGPRVPVVDETGHLQTWRAAVAGLLVGLALLTCLRHIVLIAPVLALAWWTRRPSARPSAAGYAWAAAGVAVALLPVVLLAVLGADSGIPDKSEGWQHTLVRQLGRPEYLARAASGLVTLWSNVPNWLGPAFGNRPLSIPPLIAASAAAIFVVVEGVRVLLRRSTDVVSGAVGIALATYVVMVASLYSSFPYNFTPLAPLFGVAGGMALSRLEAVLAPRNRALSFVVPLLLAGDLAWGSVQVVPTVREAPVFANIEVERAATAWLVEHDEPGLAHYTLDGLTTGVFDSLSDGRISTVRARSALFDCFAGGAPETGCVVTRLQAVIRTAAGAPVRLIVSSELKLTLDPRARFTLDELEQAAATSGYSVEHQSDFPTPTGAPGLSIYDLRPVSPRP
ncbi:MAG: hypothetical protein H6698_05665 [Myxococcales bacterium]|nr:hypothetical protein [Myxococcales bacterium]MCB9532555.1 hypothetical protein [Myxococcales bacterium]MCB9533791.1 hypothetical protein [Myxococcales bacterium]